MSDEEFEVPNIRPTPKYILDKIRKVDLKDYPAQDGHTRFYSYLTKIRKELVKITVAVRNYRKQWLCKQVTAHAVHWERDYARDIVRYTLFGYVVDWSQECKNKRAYYLDHGWGWVFPNDFDPWTTLVNPELIGTMPQYKYSGYEYLRTDRVIGFIKQYEKYPVVEFLMKFGYDNFWMSKQICEKATKDKEFRRWLIQNKNVKGKDTCYVSSLLNAYKHNVPLLEQEILERAKKELRTNEYKDLREAFKGEQETLLKYITKQGTHLSTYADYYKACTELGMDMTIDRNRYPHDFKYWHDMRIDQLNTKRAEEDKIKRAKLYEQFAQIAAKYLPLERISKDDYVVIIAQSPQDLIREGEALHHCVGRMNYDQRFIKEQSLIFFVRKADNISTPLVTLEYSLSTHKVLQLYGLKDSKPSEEIQNYVNKRWLPYANRKLKQIAA